MATDIPSEVEAFRQFITDYLDSDNEELSPEELLRRWRAEQESATVIENIRQGTEDYENGKSEPIAQAFDEVRLRLATPACQRTPLT